MAVSDEIKEQTKKLKDMTADQKADYIWTYYKWWILGTIAVVLFVISTISTVVKNSKPTYLSAIFLNSTAGEAGSRCTLETDFLKEYNVDEKEYKSEFDYSLYLDNNYANQRSMAAQMKLISMYQAGELDIVCGSKEVLEGSADVGGYGNLEEILPDGMLDKLIEKGYEPYYYTERIYDDDAEPDAEGNRPYTEGETYVGGIYIDNSKKLVGNKDTFVYSENMPDRMVLTISINAPHIDHAIEFIEYITE